MANSEKGSMTTNRLIRKVLERQEHIHELLHLILTGQEVIRKLIVESDIDPKKIKELSDSLTQDQERMLKAIKETTPASKSKG